MPFPNTCPDPWACRPTHSLYDGPSETLVSAVPRPESRTRYQARTRRRCGRHLESWSSWASTAPDEQRTQGEEEKAGADVDRLERQAFGKGIAEEHDRSIRRHHAESRTSDNGSEIGIRGGKGHRGDLCLI